MLDLSRRPAVRHRSAPAHNNRRFPIRRSPIGLPVGALPVITAPLVAVLFVAMLLVPLLALLSSSPAAASELILHGYRFDPLAGEPELPPGLAATPPLPGDMVLAIVQFDGPITADARARLTDAGAELLDYLPEFAFLVRARAPLSPALTVLEGVRWAGLYHPAFRLSPVIGDMRYIDPLRKRSPDYRLRVDAVDVMDGSETGARSQFSVEDAIRLLGGEITGRHSLRGRARIDMQLPRGEEMNLAHHPDVLWIEEIPDYEVWNNTTRWVVQSNVNNMTPIWDQGLHGEGRIVGVMDSGLDYASCWFRDDGNPLPGPSHRKVIDYQEWGGNAYDGCDTGHGTHVCGTLAGDQSFVNPGDFDYNGLAYAAKIALQDIGEDGFLACLLGLVSVPTSLTAPLQDAYDLGARAHSNSWGSTANSYDAHARDVDSFMWEHPDCLVLFAAGNWGPGNGTVGSPGTAKNCVTVGATRQAPAQNEMAGYSSRGPTADGRVKPTVTAPGGESPDFITSADNHPASSPTCQTVSSPFQGTSMATPAVAGLALIVQQYFEEGWYPRGEAGSGDPRTPSAALVKALLVNTATDMATPDIPNNNEGWGRLLLEDGLYFDGDTHELLVEEHTGLATGETASYDYVVESSDPLEIVLVWSDYPGSTSGGIAIVNDLDLVVTGPGGAYRGNVFAGGLSITGGSPDRLNVEEVVRLANPAAGNYTIDVSGFNVPQEAPGGGQPFALVATGAFGNWPPTGTAVASPEGAAEPAGKDAPGAYRRDHLVLRSVRPNPFNPTIEFRYEITDGQPAYVRIDIYDASGRQLRRLVDGVMEPGLRTTRWDGRDADGVAQPSGMYFVRLKSGSVRISKKITLLR